MSQLVRGGVALADSLLASFKLQVTVRHYAIVSTALAGERIYGAAVNRKAVVIQQTKMFRTGEGEERASVMTLVFTRPVAINPLDKFEIPAIGTTPAATREIVSIDGVLDPSTNRAFAPMVYLG